MTAALSLREPAAPALPCGLANLGGLPFDPASVALMALGLKTQDRRLAHVYLPPDGSPYRSPFGPPGRCFAVLEPWAFHASGHSVTFREDAHRLARYERGPWRGAITMPSAYARFLLQVTSVRLEELWEVTPEDLVASGFETPSRSELNFSAWWDCHRGTSRGTRWADNPLVWVLDFAVHSTEEL